MKKKKKLILIFVLIYVCISIFYSIQVNTVLNSALQTKGADNPYILISDSDYQSMDYTYGSLFFGLDPYNEDEMLKEINADEFLVNEIGKVESLSDVRFEHDHSFPITIHCIFLYVSFYDFHVTGYAKGDKNKEDIIYGNGDVTGVAIGTFIPFNFIYYEDTGY
ncbi:hypothetical protein ACTQYZ_01865 [Anaerofustis sp. LCP19S3_F7]|uniref:hypothetical protein n=1 Tax=Anaerofustis sp. LCP19S3_F7 TaxID=3440247 RepID=UPI003F8DBC4A